MSILLTSGILQQQSNLTQVPDNGLIVYCPFNGNAIDQSGNNNDGTINGATLTTGRKGDANGAYYYDVSDFISFNLSINTNYTFSLWINISDLNSSGNFRYFLGLGSNKGMSSNEGLYFYDGITNASIYELGLENLWTHVLWTKADTEYKFYINNQLEIQTSFIDFDISDMRLGIRTDGFGGWIGSIDDLRIYSRVLQSNEITQLYNE